jgi:hypothetical protein
MVTMEMVNETIETSSKNILKYMLRGILKCEVVILQNCNGWDLIRVLSI